MNKKISIYHKQTLYQSIVFWSVWIIIFIIAATQLDIKIQVKNMVATTLYLSALLNPDFSILGTYIQALLITFMLAFVGVLLAMIISLPLALLSANNTDPSKSLATIIRLIMILARSIPTTIWILMAAASIGFGSMAGLLGLLIPTSAYLVKAYIVLIEDNGYESIEALSATGSPWIYVMIHGVLKDISTKLLASTMLRLEMSVSESVILGMVGVAGIGYTLMQYIGLYKLSQASTGLILIFVVMYIMELVSKKFRDLKKR